MHRTNTNESVTPGVKGDKRTARGLAPPQNVAFAVNYSLPSVDQFIQTTRTPADRVKSSGNVGDASASASSGQGAANEGEPTTPRQREKLAEKDMNRDKRVTIVDPATSNTPAGAKRSSNRDRKPREKSREKARVRYDMNHVPAVQRHHPFVARHRRLQAISHQHSKRRAQAPRRSARKVGNDHDHAPDEISSTCHKCNGEELPAPFVADSSVVWIPTKRSDWEDCLSEMTAVCTSAALRRHVAAGPAAASKPFLAPLSQDYIRDRIDIDDPLEGYQIRHKQGGWLQGFIMWTNFTTWTHYFKWDSLDERSGVQADPTADKSHIVDADGSLSAELESQPRSGDPLATGVVFPSIAEIGLLGGIGCGEYLLRMAIDDIKSRGQYKYIVMQATDASKTFYERFGFLRVGAVCRYGINNGRGGASTSQAAAGATETDIVGYRHWTYANERNLDTYGGPSYMMALRLPSDDSLEAQSECPVCSSEVQKPSVIEQLKAFAVDEKPKIAQLGAASTPFKRASLASLSKPMPLKIKPSPYPPGAKKRGRPPKTSSADKPRTPGVSPYPPGVKKRGRPPKKAPAVNPRPPTAVSLYPPGVKKRGRPRKYPLPEPVAAHSAPAPVKRGPGRPRKHPLPEHVAVSGEPQEDGVKRKRGRGRPRKHPLPEQNPASPGTDKPKAKRIKKTVLDVANLEEQRELLMAPAPEGQKLTFSQKQYQSVWLAVPPPKSSPGGRRPPRQRGAYLGDPALFRKSRNGASQEATGATNAVIASSPLANVQQSKASPYPPNAKRRGHPPKKRRKNDTSAEGEKNDTSTEESTPLPSSAVANEENPSSCPPGVRRRGRPPKIKKPSAVDSEEKSSPSPPGVKCRGRPPKNETATSNHDTQTMAAAFAFKRRSPRFTSV
eukprot:CAMPEP_0202507654 /NCGR_PEP_ID=MMETSP1361-20130828/51841_1 /ASSEMBLY_ACC=CAM_ASM_000849 /TAXON_ID=210615 /ORGANISM="Staurosira complex sp., Strain CCMP2646" /LENGTH=895 /DNA_ID=CAMNT_0049141793 /DNA_START=1 /DNA_END=2688 /DNA_ORIENTATION=+